MTLQFFFKCLSNLATFLIVESSQAFLFVHNITLRIFIFDWDGVLIAGDNVAVPALGQSNFLWSSFSSFILFLSLKRVHLSQFGLDI